MNLSKFSLAVAALSITSGTWVHAAQQVQPQQKEQEVEQIKTATKAPLGTYLTDGEGHTVYMFFQDQQGQPVSTCYDACAGAWPPVLTAGNPQATDPQIQTALLGTITRRDGTHQVTYNGWPLYYFFKDQTPGDTKGQGVNGFGAEWFILDPAGQINRTAAPQ